MHSYKSQGFTYLALLFMVAMLGATLALTGHLWKKTMQQQKERELLFVGNQFRRAILLYYERTPSAAKQYPKDLSDLIKDNRYPSMQRYLRELYRDPIGMPSSTSITGSQCTWVDWPPVIVVT